MIEFDRLLGKRILTGDGRNWTVIKVEPIRYVSGANGAVRNIQQTMVRMDCTDHTTRAVVEMPLTVFIGALEYGLIEEL